MTATSVKMTKIISNPSQSHLLPKTTMTFRNGPHDRQHWLHSTLTSIHHGAISFYRTVVTLVNPTSLKPINSLKEKD